MSIVRMGGSYIRLWEGEMWLTSLDDGGNEGVWNSVSRELCQLVRILMACAVECIGCIEGSEISEGLIAVMKN